MANQILSMNKLKEVLLPFGVVLDYVGASVNLRLAGGGFLSETAAYEDLKIGKPVRSNLWSK